MKHSQLFKALSEYALISDTLINDSKIEMVKVVLKKGQKFIKPGDHSGQGGLVVSGLCRQYYLDEEGKEHTKCFIPEGSIGFAYAEMLTGEPVRCCIDAIVDTELQVVSHPEFVKLYELNKESEALGRRIAEQNFIEKEQREFEFLHYDAMGRYDAFLQRYAAVEHMIPQYQIASYIGITPIAMSRLMKKRRES